MPCSTYIVLLLGSVQIARAFLLARIQSEVALSLRSRCFRSMQLARREQGTSLINLLAQRNPTYQQILRNRLCDRSRNEGVPHCR